VSLNGSITGVFGRHLGSKLQQVVIKDVVFVTLSGAQPQESVDHQSVPTLLCAILYSYIDVWTFMVSKPMIIFNLKNREHSSTYLINLLKESKNIIYKGLYYHMCS
jgi:hypothetical protein